MNLIHKHLSHFVFWIALAFCSCSTLYAQEVKSINNHLGFGLHYAYGDVLYDRVGVQFSMLYERKLSDLLYVEGSINFLGSSYLADEVRGVKRLFHSVTGNGDLILNLSGNAPQQWRLGAGVSLRQLSSMFAVDAIYPYAQNGDFHYYSDYSLGANALVDLKLPLDKNMDIILRLQGQAFVVPFESHDFIFIESKQAPPIPRLFAFAVSLGAFIRIGF